MWREKAAQSERDAFGSENEVQRKMVAFLEALLKLVERNISGIKFMFSDKDEDDDTPGGIDAEELYALMFKARGTPALRRVRRSLLGVKDIVKAIQGGWRFTGPWTFADAPNGD